MTNNLFARTPALQSFVDGLSVAMGNTQTNTQALATATCMACGKEAGAFRDALSRREYGISGLCQACQDGVFEQAEPVQLIIDGVEIINVCHLLPKLLGEGCFQVPYMEQGTALDIWAGLNNADQYAAPREQFNIYEAARLAKAKGKTAVIVEDLS